MNVTLTDPEGRVSFCHHLQMNLIILIRHNVVRDGKVLNYAAVFSNQPHDRYATEAVWKRIMIHTKRKEEEINGNDSVGVFRTQSVMQEV